ncbi:MAG: hypothetical protein AAF583_15220 [Pseudomonadota bacterium]
MLRLSEAVPSHAWFGMSAVFHYLGSAFTVLLFPVVGVLGAAWFRIASFAMVLVPITKPSRTFTTTLNCEQVMPQALGRYRALMNGALYLAFDRLPISLVAAIEILCTIGRWYVRWCRTSRSGNYRSPRLRHALSV